VKIPIDLGTKFRDRIATQYPAIDKTDIPDNYGVNAIDYRKDEIEKYHVIFWHRLLRSLYQEPLEIEYEFLNNSSGRRADIQKASFRKTQEKDNGEAIGIDKALALEIETGKIKPFPVSWKYLVWLPSGGIVEFGTRDQNTIFYIAQIILSKSGEKNSSEEVKKLIDLILEEANRLSGQLFNPTKDFEKQEGIRTYLLFNVYLSNYRSAKTMFDIAESQEAALAREFLRYDARTSDLYDKEKRKYIDQHILICGMFYCSAITYFFMALEGFVNLVFHAFLKNNFRDEELRTNQRLDLEQKLRFMPSLCNGFNENSESPSPNISGFKKLKKYRNSLFHSNIEDSLKSLCFVEDGFVYTYDMDRYKDRFLPAHKINLTIKDVIEVKSIVDEIVNSILESMNQATRKVTEAYILEKPCIPFQVLATGDLVVGESEMV